MEALTLGVLNIWIALEGMVLIHMQSKCRNKKDKSEVQFCSFLTTTLDGHERLPSNSWPIYPQAKNRRYIFNRWLEGTRASLGILKKKKIFSPFKASHPRSSSQEPSQYKKYITLASSSTMNVMNNQSNLVNFKPIKIHHTAYKWHFLME